jgi:iron complex transport system ATP-binding protein
MTKKIPLEVQDVSFGYGRSAVLNKVSFIVEQGEFVALMGPNGSGKTTLLKLILGSLSPWEGAVLLDGDAVLSYPPKERAKRMAYVSQDPFISFPLTVRELVSLGRYAYANGFRESSEDQKAIDHALGLTDSLALQARKFTALSGGEKQKVLVSRALAQSSHLLLMDEPTVHLDLYFQLRILKTLKEICRKKDLTVIAVFHDLNLACLAADKALLLRSGEVQEFGPVTDVVNERSIEAVFGVEVVAANAAGLPQRCFLPRKPLG